MTNEREMLSESVGRLLAEQADTETVRGAEDTGFLPELWEMVAGSGLHLIAVSEDKGGGGGELADAHAVLWQVGRNASPIPIAETGLLGGWALAEADLALPDGVITVVSDNADGGVAAERDGSGVKLSGTAQRVAWASVSERVVVLVDVDGETLVASVPTSELTCGGEVTLASEPRETVTFEGVRVAGEDVASAPASVSHDLLLQRGALSRVTLMGGAMERAAELSERYTSERHQFGRPVSKFQAVQHHLVAVREEANRTQMVGNAALLALEEGRSAEFEIATAKVVAGESTRILARAAHQAHGAIGVTFEYDLQLFTRRLHAWRDEYGSSRYWATRVARIVADVGAGEVWPLITRSIAS